MADLHAQAAAHGGHHHPQGLQHHFENLVQQKESVTLGMWLFLAQEIMFFGGLFMAYFLYRIWYPEAWSEGSLELNVYMGGGNTIVLIGSSLTMALAVRTAQMGNNKATRNWLILTMLLGMVFVVVKGFEYYAKWEHHHIPGANFVFEGPHADQVQIFLSLYFMMTGLHALHMLIGFGVLAWIAWMAHREKFTTEWYSHVEMAGLYWHFVDIVWIFLFPLLYLVDRAHHLA